jgi:16S rRNA (cytosine967-C5)-methyltransferase
MQLDSYKKIAQQILDGYQYPEPFHLYINKCFKADKKFGSRDRRTISSILYAYFRLGNAKNNILNIDEGLQLVSDVETTILPTYNNLFDGNIYQNTIQKFKLNETHFTQNKLASLKLSSNLNWNQFQLKLLIKPFTFIKIRNTALIPALENAEHFTKLNDTTFAITKNIAIDTVIKNPGDYVVQDYNSQQVCTYFKPATNQAWWDCCAASGGKSLALLDIEKNIKLTVSDVRKNILENLRARLKIYNYKNFNTLECDANTTYSWPISLQQSSFDNIICDVPCSGSGTWARTPENYFFANLDKLSAFPKLQYNIANNVVKQLKKGGHLYYITCSVFAQENEEVVEKILANNADMVLTHQVLLRGFEQNADFLFLAILQKN